jgi:hypothetical protein
MSAVRRVLVGLCCLLWIGSCAGTDALDDDPGDDTPGRPDAAELPGTPDASVPPPPPPIDASVPLPVDAAPPPIDAAPPPADAAPMGPFCTANSQCTKPHECCVKFPPDFMTGVCAYGNIVLDACFLADPPDAGP